MRTTFYIASAPENHVAVRNLADFFQSKGWRWASGNAWGRKRSFVPGWVAVDMHAALSADVFVLLQGDERSLGAHAQLGSRWAAHKTAFVIRQGGEHHPLYELPGVVTFDAPEDFAQAVFGP